MGGRVPFWVVPSLKLLSEKKCHLLASLESRRGSLSPGDPQWCNTEQNASGRLPLAPGRLPRTRRPRQAGAAGISGCRRRGGGNPGPPRARAPPTGWTPAASLMGVAATADNSEWALCSVHAASTSAAGGPGQNEKLARRAGGCPARPVLRPRRRPVPLSLSACKKAAARPGARAGAALRAHSTSL